VLGPSDFRPSPLNLRLDSCLAIIYTSFKRRRSQYVGRSWVGWSGLCLPVLGNPGGAVWFIFGSGQFFLGI